MARLFMFLMIAKPDTDSILCLPFLCLPEIGFLGTKHRGMPSGTIIRLETKYVLDYF